MFIKIWHLFKDEKGQGLAEYALILVLIAIVCIGVVEALGFAARDLYDFVLGKFAEVF